MKEITKETETKRMNILMGNNNREEEPEIILFLFCTIEVMVGEVTIQEVMVILQEATQEVHIVLLQVEEDLGVQPISHQDLNKQLNRNQLNFNKYNEKSRHNT